MSSGDGIDRRREARGRRSSVGGWVAHLPLWPDQVIKDLTSQGIRVETHAALRPGRALRFALRDPAGRTHPVEGRVVWSRLVKINPTEGAVYEAALEFQSAIAGCTTE